MRSPRNGALGCVRCGMETGKYERLKRDLDALADSLNVVGRKDAPITLTPKQYERVLKLLPEGSNPMWRNHPLRKARRG